MHPIKTNRLSHGLSRHDLAKKLGVSYAAVTHWENGLSKPTTTNLIAMSKIFGCTVDELLEK